MEVSIELRKARKNEQILKRRNIANRLQDETLSLGEGKRNEASAGCSAPGQDWCCNLCSRYHLLLGPLSYPAQVKQPVPFLITVPGAGEGLGCLTFFCVILHGGDVLCGFPRWQVEQASAPARRELAKLLSVSLCSEG